MDYKIKGETLTEIADAIRDKTGSTEAIKPEEMSAGVENVYEISKEKAVYDWMYKFQTWYDDVKANDYLYAFAGPRWKDELYNPNRPLTSLQRTTGMYAYSGITDTKVPISIHASIYTNCTATFQNAQNLVTVQKFTVHEKLSMTNQFAGCSKLKNLTIGGTIGKAANFGDSPLTRASIMSVITALSTTTSGLTVTFKKTAVDAAFETSEGANDGSTSPIWTAMVDKENPNAIRPNWTFALK